MARIKISNLKLDMGFYPREKVDEYHVRELVEVIEAGVKVPPIVISNDKKVVDGFHRVKAYEHIYGSDYVVEAIAKGYANDAELFADGIRLNASHGRNFTPSDKVRAIVMAEKLNMTLDVVSGLLGMTPERATEMRLERYATYGMKPVILKRSAAHLAGKELSEEEYNYNQASGGLSQTFYIRQVIAMLENDTLDWEDSRIKTLVNKLAELLSNVKVPV